MIIKEKLKTFKLLSMAVSLVAVLSACNLPAVTGSVIQTTTPDRAGLLPTMTLQANPTQNQTSIVTATEPVPPTAASPNAPIWSVYHYTCKLAVGGGTMTMNLGWTDRSNNEDGFNVYRDGQVIATLAPDSTSYVDVAFVATGKALNYSVEAFNKDWRGSTSTITNFCQ
jgi:hypothetical protein